MQSSHSPALARITRADFDDANLLPSAGIVPVMALARKAGLPELAGEHVRIPSDKGANIGAKTMALVAGIVMGADSIDDLQVLRAGAMGKAAEFGYAPSTIGQTLRKATFGHVRQFDAVASRFLVGLAANSGLLGRASDASTVMVDVDDTIIEVFGRKKQGAGIGYTKKRGLNALIASVSADSFAPVVAAQRLRRGPAGSSRGAHKLLADALGLVSRTALAGRRVLVRADSAFYSSKFAAAALRAGADISITVRMDKAVAKAIASVPEGAWEKIKYPRAVWDDDQQVWVSEAEVAEVAYTAFSSKPKKLQVAGRLVVRRVPEANPAAKAGQDVLFQMFRHHAFFTTQGKDPAGTAEADKAHRAHAVIEQVHADLKASGLGHMPSGRFNANGAWLAAAVMAFNLTRAAATLAGSPALAKAETATIRARLVHVPARLARSARRFRLHLPAGWPWEGAWLAMWGATAGP
jgi:hypothetical protein